jgi:hypothetical protein
MTGLAIRVLLVFALVGAFIAGYFAWADHQQGIGEARAVARYELALSVQRDQAATELALVTKERNNAKYALVTLTNQLEKDREKLQAENAADLRKRRAAPRLQYTAEAPERRSGSESAAGDASSPASDASPAVVQLPESISGRLQELAADAQSLAIDYEILYRYVNNPKLACELSP